MAHQHVRHPTCTSRGSQRLDDTVVDMSSPGAVLRLRRSWPWRGGVSITVQRQGACRVWWCVRSAETLLGVKSRNKTSERFLRSSSCHLCQRRLGLRQPERHRHGSIALESAAQDGSCWPMVAYSVPRPCSTRASVMRCLGASMGLPPTQMRWCCSECRGRSGLLQERCARPFLLAREG